MKIQTKSSFSVETVIFNLINSRKLIKPFWYLLETLIIVLEFFFIKTCLEFRRALIISFINYLVCKILTASVLVLY